MTTDNRDKFIYLAGRYGQIVKFYNVEKLCADKINEMIELIPSAKTSWLSVAALYRLLVPQLFTVDIEKCIYLDSDIIINLDISELWRLEIGDKILAAVPESYNGVNTQERLPLCREGYVAAADYFNSGVLLMNLKILRSKEETIKRGVKFIGSSSKYNLLDQDILNYIFSTDYFKLPVEFNYLVKDHRSLNRSLGQQKIYHFAARVFGLNMSDPFNKLWMRYFMKTPWFDEEAIGRLYTGFQQVHVGLKQSMIQISAMMSGKTRAFFAVPNNIDGLKKLFSIREDEEIIFADNSDALRKLFDAMKKARGMRVFFIMLPGFPYQMLTEAGFTAGKDFVNGLEFLSEAQGVPFNSYPLIQAM